MSVNINIKKNSIFGNDIFAEQTNKNQRNKKRASLSIGKEERSIRDVSPEFASKMNE